jgi:hypothetical protein
VEIKGRAYSLGEALRDATFDTPCLVIGILMLYAGAGRLIDRLRHGVDTMVGERGQASRVASGS